jgi:transcriptional regulator with XRE-family HTH domain
MNGPRHRSIGERIYELRAHFMTQRELAERAGVSVSLIRNLEQGRRQTASIGSLHKIAAALDVEVAALLPRTRSLPSTDPDAGVVGLRNALMSLDMLGYDADLTGTGLPGQVVVYGWGEYWAGRYDTLTETLPATIRQLRVCLHDASREHRPELSEALAHVYWITGSILVHLGHPDLAWLAITRAVSAAEAGNDPLFAVTVRGSVAWQLLTQGRYDDSQKVAEATAASIEPSGKVTPQQMSVYGNSLIIAATGAGRGQRAGQAHDLLAEARDIAQLTGERNDYETVFGPSRVAMQTVDVHVVTDEFGKAISAAKALPRGGAGLPPAARCRHLSDLAYSNARLGRHQRALDALLVAERTSPSWVKHEAFPRAIVAELIEAERRAPSQLRDLATRIGVRSATPA